jgi:hypothetical protein
MDGRGSIRSKDKYFSVLHSVHTGSGADPASYPMGTGGSSPGIKRQGREADLYLVPSSRNVEPYLHTWRGA